MSSACWLGDLFQSAPDLWGLPLSSKVSRWDRFNFLTVFLVLVASDMMTAFVAAAAHLSADLSSSCACACLLCNVCPSKPFWDLVAFLPHFTVEDLLLCSFALPECSWQGRTMFSSWYQHLRMLLLLPVPLISVTHLESCQQTIESCMRKKTCWYGKTWLSFVEATSVDNAKLLLIWCLVVCGG